MSAFRKQAIAVVVGALLLSMATGCSRNPAGVDDGTDTGNGQTDIGNGGGTVNPGGSTGGGVYNPTPVTPVVPVKVTAMVTNKARTGTILLWWRRGVSATIQLSNPSTQNVTGKVVLTFSKDGEQVETQEQPFSLAGGQTSTIEAKSTKAADDVVADAQTDSTPTGGSYGSGTSYGSSTGSSTGWPSGGSSF